MTFLIGFVVGIIFGRYFINFLDIFEQYVATRFNCEISKITLKNNQFVAKSEEIQAKFQEGDVNAIGFTVNYEDDYEDDEEWEEE